MIPQSKTYVHVINVLLSIYQILILNKDSSRSQKIEVSKNKLNVCLATINPEQDRI